MIMETRTDPKTVARWAGAGYLAIFVFSIFGNFLAVGAVFDPSDAATTADRLVEHETTFRLGIVAFLAVFLLDIAVAWSLYALFRSVRADLSLVSAWFRLAYSVMLGVALVFLYLALQLADQATSNESEIQLAMRAFEFTWLVGLAAFGIHLVLMGRLLFLTDHGPRVIGSLLIVAGSAYLIDTIAHIVLPDYQAVSGLFLAFVAIPSIAGELSLTVWLLRIGWRRRPVPARRTVSTAVPEVGV
jgi:hypothetical protein